MKMNARKGRTHVVMVGVVLVGLALAGCRTYGQYGNKGETLTQIHRANELFAEQLDRARADGNLLARVAQGDPVLQPFVERYQALLLTHEAVLAENKDLAARFEKGNLDSYRALNRTFGAILSQEQVIRSQYAELRKAIAHLSDTTATPAASSVLEPRFTKARYRFVPVYYHQVSNTTQELTMREALARSGRIALPGTPERTGMGEQENG